MYDNIVEFYQKRRYKRIMRNKYICYVTVMEGKTMQEKKKMAWRRTGVLVAEMAETLRLRLDGLATYSR